MLRKQSMVGVLLLAVFVLLQGVHSANFDERQVEEVDSETYDQEADEVPITDEEVELAERAYEDVEVLKPLEDQLEERAVDDSPVIMDDAAASEPSEAEKLPQSESLSEALETYDEDEDDDEPEILTEEDQTRFVRSVEEPAVCSMTCPAGTTAVQNLTPPQRKPKKGKKPSKGRKAGWRRKLAKQWNKKRCAYLSDCYISRKQCYSQCGASFESCSSAFLECTQKATPPAETNVKGCVSTRDTSKRCEKFVKVQKRACVCQ